MAATCVLGLGFLAIEIHEFVGLIDQGAGPTRSAFLSAFFTLVGCHGVHVTLGILWLLTMIAQVFAKGYRSDILRRVLCFALFWHTLDIIWVAIFTVVYLLGAGAMSSTDDYEPLHGADHAPGDEPARGREVAEGVLGYLVGLGLAILLTAVVVLHCRNFAGLAPKHPDCAGRAGDRADWRASGFLPAHHHRARTTSTTCWRSRSAS